MTTTINSPEGEMFGLNAFFPDGDTICRTYFTSWRGLEVIGPGWSFLDQSLPGPGTC
jgi:predicted dithiol-disulfide oxidoreductase (DUF899 family)